MIEKDTTKEPSLWTQQSEGAKRRHEREEGQTIKREIERRRKGRGIGGEERDEKAVLEGEKSVFFVVESTATERQRSSLIHLSLCLTHSFLSVVETKGHGAERLDERRDGCDSVVAKAAERR